MGNPSENENSNENEEAKVFIQIEKPDGVWQIYEAREYQKTSLNDYINNNKKGIIEYKPCYSIQFWLSEFSMSGLEGNYDDFYYMEREDGSKSIISRNEEKLRYFIGYMNRLTT